MESYGEFRPTAFDPKGLGLQEQQDWMVLPTYQTRDSEHLTKSNFEAALEMLGGEGDDVEVHRFGHWGPGWFEIIIVRPGTDALVKAESTRTTASGCVRNALEWRAITTARWPMASTWSTWRLTWSGTSVTANPPTPRF